MPSKTETFRQLHESKELFVMPNPWDIGSALLLEGAGFKALATTSGGMAYAAGKRDGRVTREEALAHCHDMVNSTSVPISADLENGFGDSAKDVFETVTSAVEVGLAGCSIEDHTRNPEDPIYDPALATERMQAAVEACRSVAPDFVLTARCENLVWGTSGLDEVITQLQAYEAAGADVLFAPGLKDAAAIEAVLKNTSKPLSVLASSPSLGLSVEDMAKLGVARISTGSAFTQLAYASLMNAVKEIKDSGTFRFTSDMADYEELESYFV